MNIRSIQGMKAAGIIYSNDEEIRGFFDDYRFLSNFHISACLYEGSYYMSVEHAFMAQKATTEEDMPYVPVHLILRKQGNVASP